MDIAYSMGRDKYKWQELIKGDQNSPMYKSISSIWPKSAEDKFKEVKTYVKTFLSVLNKYCNLQLKMAKQLTYIGLIITSITFSFCTSNQSKIENGIEELTTTKNLVSKGTRLIFLNRLKV
jgi:hypothetical protein